jgi:GH25 family lysozyme M1 (1,4-beta-N-acetylmuramidase)
LPAEADVVERLTEFIDALERGGVHPVLYVRDDLASRYDLRLGDQNLWCFRFLRRPSDARCVAWQVDGYASVNGVDGRVDLDVGFPALFVRRE